jgi:aspartate carbamoyltransferase catalytic subunit
VFAYYSESGIETYQCYNRSMSIQHIVSATDLSKETYDEIVRRSRLFVRDGIPKNVFESKVASTLFFQPSTRTSTMFQSAAIRGGGGWIGVSGDSALSMAKGESLEDTIKSFAEVSDIIALRHGDDDSAERAAQVSSVPVVNCGSGSREHGVGSAMMLCILAEYLQVPLTGAKIGIYGTPQINRAVKAMLPIFGMYNTEVFVDDLGHFPFPDEVVASATKQGMQNITYSKLDDFIGDIDVLFVTRALQKGIIPDDQFPQEKQDQIMAAFKPLSLDQVQHMKPEARVFMIKPLIFEVDKSVDSDPRAAYTQYEPFSEIGMAVMTTLLGIDV